MKRILVIVVTYNGLKWMDRCLGSLRESEEPVDVMVIDNGSSDGTPDHIRKNYPEVMLHDTGANHGFGRANNIGLRHALEKGYGYVYLLNQDAWVFPDTFGKLVAAMESDRTAGVVSPMQMTASADRPDPRFRKWCPQQALSDLESGRSRLYHVRFVMAAHWLISRECLVKTGGFSPAFRHYGEDDNFLDRARAKGFRVGILSGAKAVHDREMRPYSKKAAMKLKCTGSVVKVSNPANRLWFRLLFQPLELLGISLRYMSWDVFRFIFGFIGSYRSLAAYRKESMKDGAFL